MLQQTSASRPRRANAAAIRDAEERRQRQIGFLIRKIYQKNQVLWQSLCVDGQTTSVQAATLRVLLNLGPSSLTVLGRAAAMDPATTRGVVARLRRRGMISLASDARDRRKVIVAIEQPGLHFLRRMDRVMERIAAATLDPLTAAERRTLQALLLKVTAAEDAPDGA